MELPPASQPGRRLATFQPPDGRDCRGGGPWRGPSPPPPQMLGLVSSRLSLAPIPNPFPLRAARERSGAGLPRRCRCSQQSRPSWPRAPLRGLLPKARRGWGGGPRGGPRRLPWEPCASPGGRGFGAGQALAHLDLPGGVLRGAAPRAGGAGLLRGARAQRGKAPRGGGRGLRPEAPDPQFRWTVRCRFRGDPGAGSAGGLLPGAWPAGEGRHPRGVDAGSSPGPTLRGHRPGPPRPGRTSRAGLGPESRPHGCGPPCALADPAPGLRGSSLTVTSRAATRASRPPPSRTRSPDRAR